jgi:hypothetical protein
LFFTSSKLVKSQQLFLVYGTFCLKLTRNFITVSKSKVIFMEFKIEYFFLNYWNIFRVKTINWKSLRNLCSVSQLKFKINNNSKF